MNPYHRIWNKKETTLIQLKQSTEGNLQRNPFQTTQSNQEPISQKFRKETIKRKGKRQLITNSSKLMFNNPFPDRFHFGLSISHFHGRILCPRESVYFYVLFLLWGDFINSRREREEDSRGSEREIGDCFGRKSGKQKLKEIKRGIFVITVVDCSSI